MDKRVVASLIAVLLLAVACSRGAVSALVGTDGAAPPIEIEQSDEAPPPSELADVVERVLPAVVNVRVTSLNFDLGAPQEGSGEGSGVVIDPDGIILTNFHVVRDAVEVTVVFNDPDQTSVEGEVVGADPQRDLAVIKVDDDDLTAVEIGSSGRLRLGDDVVAIGFPLGLGPTVTKGIISAKDRQIEVGGDAGRLEGLLQTDAAINPGNSGGALIDRAGRLVGINTAAAQAAAAENIGFAIAIDEALPVVQQILDEPPEKHAWLGVSLRSMDPGLAAQLGLPVETEGAVVAGTFPGSPALEAGLEAGDVIVGVGDEEIASAGDLIEVLTTLDPGDEVALRVLNTAGTRAVEVTLARRPALLSQD